MSMSQCQNSSKRDSMEVIWAASEKGHAALCKEL